MTDQATVLVWTGVVKSPMAASVGVTVSARNETHWMLSSRVASVTGGRT